MSSNSSNPWGPNEPASTVVSEEAWLQGETVSAIAYGAELVLFIQCFILLSKQTKRSNYKAKLPFLIIVCLIFMFGTFFMGSAMKFNQLAFIEDRNFPGGPSAFENDEFAIPVDALGNVSFVLSNWLCDALLIWRYMVIYKGCRVPMWVVMTLPVITFMGSFALGVLFLLQVSSASPFVNTALNWTIPYFSLSLALNILVTLAIVARLLFFRRRVAAILGSAHGSDYTSLAAMVIESASLFSIFLLCFLVPFAINSSIAEVFIQSMGQVQSCATLLIIFRAASGSAWSAETQRTLISMRDKAHHALGVADVGADCSFPVGSATAIGARGNALGPSYASEKSASTFVAHGLPAMKYTDAKTNSSDADSIGDASEKV